MISNKADVLRDGAQTEIPIEDVVPGDMVRLSAGDMIPADIRFIFTKDAFVAQGSLTGGNESGRKVCGYPLRQGRRADRPSKHRLYGHQHGKRQCSRHRPATNNETYFGSMAKSLSGDRAKNSFEQGCRFRQQPF